jgi:hypothetical protein
MEWVSDMLLATGALGAGFYCMILSRRLRRFTDLERGVGGAVAVLSAQVDDLKRALGQAQATAQSRVGQLTEANQRAEAAVRRIELLIASLHDLPEAGPAPSRSPMFVRHPEAAGQR